jgi:SEL1 protein
MTNEDLKIPADETTARDEPGHDDLSKDDSKSDLPETPLVSTDESKLSPKSTDVVETEKIETKQQPTSSLTNSKKQPEKDSESQSEDKTETETESKSARQDDLPDPADESESTTDGPKTVEDGSTIEHSNLEDEASSDSKDEPDGDGSSDFADEGAVKDQTAASSIKSPTATDTDSSIPESKEIRERRRQHQEFTKQSQIKTQRAEESLITDAVTNGNRGVQSEQPDSNAAASSESKAETEMRDIMEHARRLMSRTKSEKPDYGRAFELCAEVAERGGLDGVNCLGEMYKHGLGRDRDLERAVEHFEKAAAQGHPGAQRNLAFLYSSGHGVAQNPALAVLHLHFAAVSGDHMAQLAMGYRHMYGIGVPKNCQTAMEFYMPAAEFVVKEMHSNRAQPMIEKQSLATDVAKAKGSDLDDDVVNYYAYSADRGDAAAQVALGQLHFMGARGLQQDYAEAFRWYARAAEQGDANAMGHLGNMYAQGIHVAADNQTALSYFRRGVEKGNALAQNGLGFMSMYGMGVPQSYDEAFKSFSKAAEQGNQEARFNLGALHVGGYGVAKDYAKAIYFFTLAANRGHMLALYNLAMMHHNGFGTPRSCPNAVQFIKSVCERGEWAAQLQRAYRLFHGGDSDGALLLYLELAELGFDVAQANAAHILDEERTAFTRGQKARALRAYELSAQQGNMAAELKIGDYYYHGWGTEASFRKAVAHYRAASEARVAQAMFNLGWMHEQGRGVARDRHLAKRFYDMATEAAPEAAWPAGLCLARLWLLGAGEALLERVDAAALALNLRFGRHGLKVPMSAVWLPAALEYWDALLGGALTCALLLVVALRAHLAMARLGPRRR